MIEPAAVDELMNSPYELAMASLLGLGTTSSSLLGAAIGLYVPFSKRPLGLSAGICRRRFDLRAGDRACL